MRTQPRRRQFAALLGLAPLLGHTHAAFAKQHDPGVSDAEIKLGTTSPYSGPASSFGLYGKAQSAFFDRLND